MAYKYKYSYNGGNTPALVRAINIDNGVSFNKTYGFEAWDVFDEKQCYFCSLLMPLHSTLQERCHRLHKVYRRLPKTYTFNFIMSFPPGKYD